MAYIQIHLFAYNQKNLLYGSYIGLYVKLIGDIYLLYEIYFE